MPRLSLLLALFLLTTPALAQSTPPPSYPAVPLLSTSTTILGEKIRYPSGDAHVTAAIVTLAPGARTIMHLHDVPLFAYILEGELTVDYGTHGKRTYTQGQSLMEAMAVPHFGINTGTQPMRLIGVYMGAAGANDVTPVNSDPLLFQDTPMTKDTSISLPDLNDRIAIARDNIRQITEQAAASSGAADEERNANRMFEQQEELDRLVKQRDALVKK